MIRLNDNNCIPEIGLGLWRISDADARDIVVHGVDAGYRLLDTASFYGNEKGVGSGIRNAELRREDLFITTKVWNDRHGYDETLAAFDESRKNLGLEYIDLYLIHWPVAGSEQYLNTWEALVKLREDGKVRSIGVSNFLPHHIERLLETSGVAPAVNQIEYHPAFQQKEVVDANSRHNILTEAWAPLGRAIPFSEEPIVRLAEQYGKTPAQIVLRWHVDDGRVPIPKSANPERMRENIGVFDFSLTPEEREEIAAISILHRIGDDPDEFSGIEPLNL